MNLNDVRQGWDVFSFDGQKVCNVSSVEGNYIHCSTGGLLSKDLYVPQDAICEFGHEAIRLTVPKDHIDNMHWDQVVQQGWEVYGADGNKICDVSSVEPNYIHCTAGMAFNRDLYIPRDAIREFSIRAVHLNVSKDQIDNMNWFQAPHGYGTTEYREGHEEHFGGNP